LNLFYNPDIHGDRIELDVEESRHIKAMRHQDGDVVQVTNGQGGCISGAIEWKKHLALVHVTERFEQSSPSTFIHLVMAPTKQHERMEWLLEKAVELGITSVHFVQCANGERPMVRMERLQRVAIAAIKQSQRWFLPALHDVQKFDALIEVFQTHTNLIAHCRDELPRIPIATQLPHKPVSIWIGPEGDFHTHEIERAQALGFTSISLGQARLRTETAALACIAAIQMHHAE
jgi:16S rRNA (uracil1498-N3)-methyltransferase